MNFNFMKPGAWRAVFAADDGAGAGGADTAAGDTAAATPSADAAADQKAGDPPADPPAAKWWDDKRFNEDQRGSLTALGLTVDDPLDAVVKLTDMERAAKSKLKAPPGSLIGKPADGQDLADWKKANADLFGLPEKPEDYKIDKPEGWPKDAPWDDKSETKLREIAFKHGAEPGLVQDIVAMQAETIMGLMGDADTQLEAANAEMMAALQKDWGAQTQANITRARQAAAAVAEQAGMGMDEIAQVSNVLTSAAGNANALKLFAAIGQLMGEDSLAKAGGSSGMGMTPEAARAELHRLRSPGGEYFEATKPGARRPDNYADLQKKIGQLTKLAAS